MATGIKDDGRRQHTHTYIQYIRGVQWKFKDSAPYTVAFAEVDSSNSIFFQYFNIFQQYCQFPRWTVGTVNKSLHKCFNILIQLYRNILNTS